MITSRTQSLGLIGFPIKHSLSPQIHNYIFNKYSLDAVYGCFEIQNLREAVKGLLALNFKGFNVTIPYKERIVRYLHKIDKEAAKIGAINTVKIENNNLIGFNTDGPGFIQSLKQFDFTPRNKNVLILGAGGAAKAVSIYLAKNRAKRVDFYDIVYRKAFDLSKRVRHFFSRVESSSFKNKNEIKLKDYHLLINATGIGLRKSDPLVLRLQGFNKNLLVYDLIYNPPLTPLLREAKEKGLTGINGLWMLIYQALEAQKIWYGIDCTEYANRLYKMLIRNLKQV